MLAACKWGGGGGGGVAEWGNTAMGQHCHYVVANGCGHSAANCTQQACLVELFAQPPFLMDWLIQ